ncbi:hypothetical protein PS870_03261 [Pseudomonas fluorescens]|uniref:Uncharacterized protein n=1 Tax=Pseudomonas fluorescens TaxID=294 RepID=A0A5E7L7L9_PSEFL|nr:hypothetical protein PS870_03261 [Pseudomonas fluorescens]
MVADTPPSRAGSLLQLDWVHLRNIGRLAGRLRWQASSHSGMWVPARDWSAVRPPSRASLAPTVECGYLQEIGRLSGRHREQAHSYSVMGVPAKYWSAVRPPSRASLAPTVEWVYLQEIGRLSGRLRGQASLLQWNGCTCKRLVGWQAAFAGKPRSYSGMGVPARDWSAGRPPSRASLAPTRVRCTRCAFHHSLGRALARLLLILICPPLREAEWRRSSGGWARSAVRRSRTHREEVEAKPTGGDAPR